MKQQAIQYVALDVHQATLAASVRDEQGSVVMRATVATEAKAIVGLVRGLGPRVPITFEEGTQVQWLHDLLTKHAERVIVCNAGGRGEIGNKSDRVDAERLSELLRLGALKPVYHGVERAADAQGARAGATLLWSNTARRARRYTGSRNGRSGWRDSRSAAAVC